MSQTQIVTRQIADGAINDAKVQAGAAIVSSKLADGANWIKKDGSIAMTGNLDLGSQKIVNVNTPSASSDAVNKAYVDNLFNTFPNLFKSKDEVVVAMTSNVTVSNPGTSSFDGVTLSVGDRILLTGQTANSENGIYNFQGSAVAMTRSADADAYNELPGMIVGSSNAGTSNGSKVFFCTNPQAGTLGTTAVTYTVINAASGLSNSNFVSKETPSGSINGSNTSFTLANTPVSGSEEIFLNGVLQDVGSGNDYTISANTITMLTAPLTGEKIRVNYRK